MVLRTIPGISRAESSGSNCRIFGWTSETERGKRGFKSRIAIPGTPANAFPLLPVAIAKAGQEQNPLSTPKALTASRANQIPRASQIRFSMAISFTMPELVSQHTPMIRSISGFESSSSKIRSSSQCRAKPKSSAMHSGHAEARRYPNSPLQRTRERCPEQKFRIISSFAKVPGPETRITRKDSSPQSTRR